MALTSCYHHKKHGIQKIRAWRKYQFEIPPEGTEFLNLLFFSEMPLFWFNHTFKNNWSTSMNIYTFGALLTLRIQYEYTQTQCDEDARDGIDIWYMWINVSK